MKTIMEAIKTSENVEFDVIYADGTRKRVHEGILFEMENEKIVFHNGTNSPAVLLAVGVAAAEVIGAVEFPEDIKDLYLMNVYRHVYLRKEDATP